MPTISKNHIIIDRLVRTSDFDMPANHNHPYHEFYYLVSGSRKFFINHSFYTLYPNDIMLIANGDLHRTTYNTKEQEHERICIYFDDIFLAELKTEFGAELINSCFFYPKLTLVAKENDYVLSLFDKMLTEQEEQDSFTPFLLKQWLKELLLFILRIKLKNRVKLGAVNQAEIDISERNLQKSALQIQKAARFICDNYHKGITLNEAAAKANMSATYFSMKFKEETGFGFKEYLNHMRLKEALHLLTETKESITDIALQCGFNDSNYFSDVFRKVYGISPREYRKKATVKPH